MHSVLCIIVAHQTRVELRSLFEGAFGLLVFSAANPVEGLAILQKIKPPAFILLSDELVLMSVEEFLQLKARDPALKDVPVVLLSKNEAREVPAGVCGVLTVPVDEKQVAEVVKRHCGIQLG